MTGKFELNYFNKKNAKWGGAEEEKNQSSGSSIVLWIMKLFEESPVTHTHTHKLL